MKDLVSQDTKMGRSRAGRFVGIQGSLPMAGAPTLPAAAPNGRYLSLLSFIGAAQIQAASRGWDRMKLPWK